MLCGVVGKEAEYGRVQDGRSRKREAEGRKRRVRKACSVGTGTLLLDERPTGDKGGSDSGMRGSKECTLSPQGNLGRGVSAACDWPAPMTTGTSAGIPMETDQDV